MIINNISLVSICLALTLWKCAVDVIMLSNAVKYGAFDGFKLATSKSDIAYILLIYICH